MATATCVRPNLILRVHARTKRLFRNLSSQSHMTSAQIRQKRNDIFESEKKRQLSLIRRIEKIQVELKGPPEDCTLVMNKHLSTPFNCAMHIQELLMRRSALALVNGKPWDMHRPLEEDCKLHFLHFREEDPRLVNDVFWTSCSFLVGHVMETAFKENHSVRLVNFPPTPVTSGSFVYDVDLGLKDWKPSTVELNCLTRIGYKLRYDDLRFERLTVDAAVATQMFENNAYKLHQIEKLASEPDAGSKVTLYKMGSHIDITEGPMISSTSHIGRFTISAIHDVTCPVHGPLQRVQGVATPTQLKLHYWSYDVLVRRSAKLNPAPLPGVSSVKGDNSVTEEAAG